MKSVFDRVVPVMVTFLCALWVHFATAQTFPSKPVRIIVPTTSGGLSDGLARAVGQRVGEAIGQPVIIENRPGGNFNIGMAVCAKAPPDGYTLCLTTPDPLSYNPHLFTSLPFDPDNDFAPVIQLVKINGVIVTRPELPFNSIKDIVAFDKAKPGALNWATLGPGSVSQVYLGWIKNQTGAGIIGVPYKGANQLTAAVLGGEVQLTYVGLGFAMNLIDAGRLKPLAVTGAGRSPALPEVSTLEEQGSDPGLRSWVGVFAPAKTPKPIIDRLNLEFTKALHLPAIQAFLKTQTFEPVGNSPAEFGEFLKADRANAGRIFKTLGIGPGNAQ